MEKMIVHGGHKLKGTVKISGMKNAAVAVLPAALIASGETTITNVPEIADTAVIKEIMEYLGAEVSIKDNVAKIDSSKLVYKEIKEELSSKFRGSYYFMGVLLARFGKVKIHFPGGCAFEPRPIDLHIKGFEKLGVKIKEENDTYTMDGSKLKGAHINLSIASVGATMNLMFVASKAKGVTIIENAACEPEIVNVATILNSMGANIKNAGTRTITIIGVEELKPAYHEVIPDRIEAGTFLVIGALLAEKLIIKDCIPFHLKSTILKLKEIGVDIKQEGNDLIVKKAKKISPTKIRTDFYPGFPTDMQQVITPLLLQAEGVSEIIDTIYENRFKHIYHFNKMNAELQRKPGGVIISGPRKLKPAIVEATDLRAGVALMISALTIKGKTEIYRINHLLRGYEDIAGKLTKIGAKVELL